MKPILCIAQPETDDGAIAIRREFPKEYVIINGIQFTGLEGEYNYLPQFKLIPNTYLARIDRLLFPEDTTLILPEWMDLK